MGPLLLFRLLRLSRQAGSCVFGLTDRERDMAWYIAQGRSKGRISEELFISENTVKGYTRSLYVKIGVHSKQQLLDTLSKVEHRRAE